MDFFAYVSTTLIRVLAVDYKAIAYKVDAETAWVVRVTAVFNGATGTPNVYTAEGRSTSKAFEKLQRHVFDSCGEQLPKLIAKRLHEQLAESQAA